MPTSKLCQKNPSNYTSLYFKKFFFYIYTKDIKLSFSFYSLFSDLYTNYWFLDQGGEFGNWPKTLTLQISLTYCIVSPPSHTLPYMYSRSRCFQAFHFRLTYLLSTYIIVESLWCMVAQLFYLSKIIMLEPFYFEASKIKTCFKKFYTIRMSRWDDHIKKNVVILHRPWSCKLITANC